MLKLFAGAALAALVSMGGATAASLDAYGRLPAMSDVELSGDGQSLAYVQHDGDISRVVIMSLGDGQTQSVDFGKVKLRDISWPDPGHVLVEVSRTDSIPGMTYVNEFFQATSINIKTGATIQIPKRSIETITNYLTDMPMGGVVGGKPVIFAKFYAGEAYSSQLGRYDLYRVDPDTGIAAMQQMGDISTQEFLAKTDGTVVARVRYQRDNSRWSLELRRNGAWVDAHVETAPIDSPDLVGLTLDEKAVLIRLWDEKEHAWRLAPISLEDGKLGDFLPPKTEVSGVLDPGHHVIGFGHDGVFKSYEFVEPRMAAAWEAFKGVFPGRQLTLASASSDYSKTVVYVEGTGEPGGYYLLDLTAKKLKKVGSAYPDIAPADVAEVRTVKYAAADGLEINGFLTLPPGKAPKNLPLIVLPHGGPRAADKAGFDWWSQALASQGYAVLQANFRGSTGYSADFLSAADGEWGGKMQTDLSDGVRSLAKLGLVDPKRVCIVGASYGGYAALQGITQDKGVYRCAVSVAGLSNIPKAMSRETARHTSDSSTADSPVVRDLKRYFAVTSPSDAKLAARSPVNFAAQADGPVLLIHGKDDTVVNYDQSTDMRAALEHAHKPVEMVNLGAEDHWLSRQATRQQMLSAIVKFLQENNPAN